MKECYENAMKQKAMLWKLNIFIMDFFMALFQISLGKVEF